MKRGTLTMKLAEHSTLRKDGCDNLAYAILTRASTMATMWLSKRVKSVSFRGSAVNC